MSLYVSMQHRHSGLSDCVRGLSAAAGAAESSMLEQTRYVTAVTVPIKSVYSVGVATSCCRAP
jgi:hypothetical protein